MLRRSSAMVLGLRWLCRQKRRILHADQSSMRGARVVVRIVRTLSAGPMENCGAMCAFAVQKRNPDSTMSPRLLKQARYIVYAW